MSHKSEEANVQFRNTCPSAGNLFTKSVLILLATLLLSTAGQAETVTNYGPISNSPSNQIRPGQVVWADLLTNDVAAASEFYSKVFGWEMKFNSDRSYAHATLDGDPVAAIASYTEGEEENAEGVWLMSISVRDVSSAQKAVNAAGGKVLEGPENLEGRGQFILVEDPRGAILMLLRASNGDPEDSTGDPSNWLWAELWTDDIAASTKFYEKVIGYKSVAVKGTTGKTYHVMGRDQKPRVSVIKSPFDDVSPNWLPYVKVKDVDAVAIDVIKHGGKVLVPPERDDLNYHVAIVADPTGGVFAIQEQEEQQ
jgi:predicted enzyme related to lactoylglutathione lyase